MGRLDPESNAVATSFVTRGLGARRLERDEPVWCKVKQRWRRGLGRDWQPGTSSHFRGFSTRPAVFFSSARAPPPPLLPTRSVCYRKLLQRQEARLCSVALPGAGQLFCYVAVISIFHAVACHALMEAVRLCVFVCMRCLAHQWSLFFYSHFILFSRLWNNVYKHTSLVWARRKEKRRGKRDDKYNMIITNKRKRTTCQQMKVCVSLVSLSLYYTGKLYLPVKFNSRSIFSQKSINKNWDRSFQFKIKVEISFLVILIFSHPKLYCRLATPIGAGPDLDKCCVWKLMPSPLNTHDHNCDVLDSPRSSESLFCFKFCDAFLACSVWCPWVWTPRTRSACGTGGEAKSWQPRPVTPTG